VVAIFVNFEVYRERPQQSPGSDEIAKSRENGADELNELTATIRNTLYIRQHSLEVNSCLLLRTMMVMTFLSPTVGKQRDTLLEAC
jgi:hypothetical protein